jgi:hypothetical protein
MNGLLLKALSSVDAPPILASPESRKGLTWSPDVDVIESAGGGGDLTRSRGNRNVSGDASDYIAQSTFYSVVLPSNCSSSLSASSRVWWTTPSR